MKLELRHFLSTFDIEDRILGNNNMLWLILGKGGH